MGLFSRYLSIVLLLGLVSCASTRQTRQVEANNRGDANRPVIKIIGADLKLTFQAAQRALSIYAVRTARVADDGKHAKIITEPIIGESYNPKLYTSPVPPRFYHDVRSSLILRFREGKKHGQIATKVEVQKKIQRRKNYEGWVDIGSDALEEKIVMDQITEEVNNTYALRRVQEKTEKSDPMNEEDTDE